MALRTIGIFLGLLPLPYLVHLIFFQVLEGCCERVLGALHVRLVLGLLPLCEVVGFTSLTQGSHPFSRMWMNSNLPRARQFASIRQKEQIASDMREPWFKEVRAKTFQSPELNLVDVRTKKGMFDQDTTCVRIVWQFGRTSVQCVKTRCLFLAPAGFAAVDL